MNSLKNLGKVLVWTVCIGLGMEAKAQSHVRNAPNCMQYEAYLKETSKTKNAVSCVDCYCKACGDKKKKDKEARVKAEEQANMKKNTIPQKKVAAKTTTKAKENELVLVGPKQSGGKSTVLQLSADDQQILDAAKQLEKTGDDLTFRSVGPHIRVKGYENTIMLSILGPSAYSYTTLRKNFIIRSSFEYDEAFGMVSFGEKESFLRTGLYVVKIKDRDYKVFYDLADIQGNCILNNKEINDISYDPTSNTFLVQKRGQSKPTEAYNPVTKKITQIR